MIFLFIIGYIITKCNNKDLQSLVAELSYEEKIELEKSLKKDRMMVEVVVNNRFLEFQEANDIVESEFRQNSLRLKTRGSY